MEDNDAAVSPDVCAAAVGEVPLVFGPEATAGVAADAAAEAFFDLSNFHRAGGERRGSFVGFPVASRHTWRGWTTKRGG